MIGELSGQQLFGLAIAAIALVVFLGFLAYVAQGRRRPRDLPDIPPAMQPGPADADLEKPRLEKLQGYAIVFILALVVMVPVTWLMEPSANLSQDKTLVAESVERGRQSVLLYSESNPLGVGCVRCHGDTPILGGGENLFNGSVVPVPSLRNVCGGPNTGHPLIHNIVDVRNTIMQGRPNTDMPSWSVRFAGALDDQQIADLVNYIVEINHDEVSFKQNVCENPKAKGYQAPVVPAQ